MTDTISIREFEDADLGQVLEVLRAALGETPILRRTAELFSWKHLRNPFGRSILLVATDADRIVGVRAFMRWELATPEGRILRCVRAVDTATHPEYHRRGIFSRLTTEAVERAEADGVDLIFNTPNPNSGAGYLKMGWQEVGPIGILARPSLRLLRGGEPSDPPVPEEYLDLPIAASITEGADRPAVGLRTPRTEAYRAWRFQQHPTVRYFQVQRGDSTAFVRPNVRSGRRELVVSEVIGPEPARAIRETVAVSRADYLAAWWSKGSPERSAAARSGLVPVPGQVALTLVCRPLHDVDVDVGALASWDLALSDLELL